MKPMLARTLGPKYNFFPCFVQPKLNGVRALYQSGIVTNGTVGVFQSRDEKLWSKLVLAHLHDELVEIDGVLGQVILDGELYVHGWRLQRINGAVAVNRKEPNEDTPHIEFHVFDIVDPSRSFSQRWFDLYHPLQEANLPHIKVVPTMLVQNREEMERSFHLYTKLGYEGIMLRPDGPYEFGEHLARHGNNMTTFRSRFLWKHKQWEDGEFVCVGTTQGEGKADIGIGALKLISQVEWTMRQQHIYREGAEFKVGTGFTDEERIDFMQNPPIGKLVKIRYLELTKDGIPFNPSFLAVMS